MNSLKLFIAFFAMLSFTESNAQFKNAKIETVKIYGNCDMCKSTIEKAGNVKRVSRVLWNQDTKMAVITYDSAKTNMDEILKRIALVGYDNEKFLAPDDTYAKLSGCCQYERKFSGSIAKPKTESAKMQTHKEHNDPSEKPIAEKTKTKDNKSQGTHSEKPIAVKTKKKKVEEHSKHSEKPLKKEQASENQLKKVFASYFALKDALVKTDPKTASLKAQELTKSLASVDMNKLAPAEHTVWMSKNKDLTIDAENISKSQDVKQQRIFFMSLSKNMYVLRKVVKTESPVYYQFCPMANEGKGANWLSKENPVKNPYYGSQMLSCGKTVETIK